MIYTRQLQRRFVTLIEMMIVMFLIALITGVVAYNYRGSLDEGKAFKTKVAIEKIETILNLEVAKHPEIRENIETEWKGVISNSPLVQDPKALLKDGWGDDYEVEIDENGTIRAKSKQYDEYIKTHQTSFS
jgi:type II secretory pathway pseudopilin PulG